MLTFSSWVTLQVMLQCVSSGALKPQGGAAEEASPVRRPRVYRGALSPLRDPRVAPLRGQGAATSATSRGSTGFGGSYFWLALQSSSVEKEARSNAMFPSGGRGGGRIKWPWVKCFFWLAYGDRFYQGPEAEEIGQMLWRIV